MTKDTVSENAQLNATELEMKTVHDLWERSMTYVDSDPIASMLYARLTLETIMVLKFKQVYKKEPGKGMGLKELIEKVKSKVKLPTGVAEAVVGVQNFGNMAAHAIDITTLEEELKGSSNSTSGMLMQVVKWFNPNIINLSAVRPGLSEAEPPAGTSPYVLKWNQDKKAVNINIRIGQPKADEVRQWLVQHYGVAKFWTINKDNYLTVVEPALRNICR